MDTSQFFPRLHDLIDPVLQTIPSVRTLPHIGPGNLAEDAPYVLSRARPRT